MFLPTSYLLGDEKENVTHINNRPRNLDDEEVKALCVDSCRSSLDSAKGKIKSACGGKEDVIVNNRIAYPGMSSC